MCVLGWRCGGVQSCDPICRGGDDGEVEVNYSVCASVPAAGWRQHEELPVIVCEVRGQLTATRKCCSGDTRQEPLLPLVNTQTDTVGGLGAW